MKPFFWLTLAFYGFTFAHAQPVDTPNVAVMRHDPRAGNEVKRMAAAYKKLVAFSVFSLDVKKIDIYDLQRRKSRGIFGTNSRAALRVENLNRQNQVEEVAFLRLMDGANLLESQDGEPTQTQTLQAARAKGLHLNLARFFGPSLGLEQLGFLVEHGALLFEDTALDGLSTRFRTLPGGDSEIEVRGQTRRPSGDVAPAVHRFRIGRSGFLKRLEYQIGQTPGHLTGVAILSTPIAVNAQTAFRWQEINSKLPAKQPAPRPKPQTQPQ